MEREEIRKQWESAAPGWAKWERTFANWMSPATEAMLEMAGVVSGAHVLDIASGAGSQTLIAAQLVGSHGHVVATDISEMMLHYVHENARAAKLDHISTLVSAAEDLDVSAESFDAAICRLGLMLFADPSKALAAAKRALKPGGKIAVVVFSTPEANPFMAKPMQVLLRHAKKEPPAPGQPGIFALGGAGVLKRLFTTSGFTDWEQRTFNAPFRMPSAMYALNILREAAGAYRAVISDCSEAVQTAAWAEVAEALESFETEEGFQAPAEILVAASHKPV
ncbi:MAG TPA: class I SAM-dependent methyltransferase [Balneolaceae bacterium]|nr:class I SAM-dependent methyltransferase [Balneolaceae bacterium]